MSRKILLFSLFSFISIFGVSFFFFFSSRKETLSPEREVASPSTLQAPNTSSSSLFNFLMETAHAESSENPKPTIPMINFPKEALWKIEVRSSVQPMTLERTENNQWRMTSPESERWVLFPEVIFSEWLDLFLPFPANRQLTKEEKVAFVSKPYEATILFFDRGETLLTSIDMRRKEGFESYDTRAEKELWIHRLDNDSYYTTGLSTLAPLFQEGERIFNKHGGEKALIVSNNIR